MKQYLASGLALATMMAFSMPIIAFADDDMEQNNNNATEQQTNSYSSTSSSSTTSQPMTSNLSQAAQFGYTTNEVIVGSSDGSGPTVLPKINIGLGNTSIRVLNPNPKPVTFSSPQLNLSETIPANGQRVIQVDRATAANLTPGQEVAYYINDSEGNQIASSSFVNNQEVASMIDTNTFVATEEETTRTSTYTPTPTQQPSQSRSTVRGYW